MDRTGRGGGLMIAISNRFSSVKLNLDLPDIEKVEVLGVKVWLGDKWISFINIYAPEGKITETWLQKLVRKLHPPFFILGDFNQKHVAWGNDSNTTGSEEILRWFTNNNICILNTCGKTHFAPTGAFSLIDLSFCSPDQYRNTNTYVHPDLFDSDHFPIFHQVLYNVGPTNCWTFTNWDGVYQQFNQELDEGDNISISDFNKCFRNVKKENSYKHNIKMRDNPPWWDVHCSWLLGQKRKFLRLSKRCLSRDSWIKYKEFAARLRQYMKKCARSYWGHICEKTDRGSMYQIIKAIAKRKSRVDSHLFLEGENGDIPDPANQADAFAAYFGDCEKLEGIPYDFSSSNKLWVNDFTMTELTYAISQAKNTTPGEDGIPAQCYKNLSISNKEKILHKYNQMFHSGEVPSSWQMALILPIWKCGKPKNSVTSYRPISLTAVGCKIMERMVLKRLLDWVMTNRIFHERHYGFLPGRDCMKALNLFHNGIKCARSNGNYVVAVKLDINAAYDSVWRDGLLYKMCSIGIAGSTALWISKWLGNRSIKIRWRGAVSSPVQSHRGVPQGSVLSPLLFMIFMYDIFECVDSGVECILYADDVILYYSDSSMSRVVERLQETLNRIQQWCSYWKLYISPDKSTAINFSRRIDAPSRCLRLYGTDISWENSMKFLGVIFTRSLRFTAHIQYIQKKLIKRLNLLKAIASPRWGVRTLDLLKIVNAIIRGTIEYACPMYKDAPKYILKRLEVVYNSALRFAMGLPMWTPIFKLYREAGQCPLFLRREFLTNSFHVRNSAANSFSLCPVSFSGNNYEWKCNGAIVHSSMLIQNYWPYGQIEDFVEIMIEQLPFQNKHAPPQAIQSLFYEYIYQFPEAQVIATDASKDKNKTSIAAINMTYGSHSARLVHHTNSVFTAEVQAITLGIQSLTHKGRVIILTDSKSALEALKNCNYKSPNSILYLFHILRNVRQNFQISLLWVPGHVGIDANEQADNLAKNGPFGTALYKGVSPEDIKSCFKNMLKEQAEIWWQNSKYAQDSNHLGTSIYRWTQNRREDVLIARFRTLTYPTEYLMSKFKYINSPLCTFCANENGTLMHYIFKCRAWADEKKLLFEKLNIHDDDLQWNVLWNLLSTKASYICLFARLYLRCGRF